MSVILREEWDTGGNPIEAAQSLMAVSAALSDIELPILAARRIAQQDMVSRFETQTDPDGQPWVPLTADYLEQKLKDGYPEDILTRTGDMKEAASQDEAWLVTENSLVFDSSAMPFYAMIHQAGSDPFGAAGSFDENGNHVPAQTQTYLPDTGFAGGYGIGKGNALPQRKWIGLSDEAEGKIEVVFDLWFDEAVSIAIQPETALFPGMVQHRTASGQFGSEV